MQGVKGLKWSQLIATMPHSATYDAPRSVVLSPASTVFRRADDVNCYVVMDDRSQNISKNQQATSKVLRRNGDLQQVPHWQPTNVSRQRAKFSRSVFVYPWDLPTALQY